MILPVGFLSVISQEDITNLNGHESIMWPYPNILVCIYVRTTIVKYDWQLPTVWIDSMVLFWARTPSTSVQPSMDNSRESSNNPP